MNWAHDPLLKPGEVATIMRVDPKTVTRWAKNNRLPSTLTPGGHHRFRESDIRALLDSGFNPVAEEAADAAERSGTT